MEALLIKCPLFKRIFCFMEQVKYVYSIGCSYSGGVGLEDWKDRFSTLLSERLGAEEVNEAMGGGSNQRIFRKVIDWVVLNPDKLKHTLFLVQWTYAGRNELWYCGPTPNEKGEIEYHPDMNWDGNWYNSHYGHDGYTDWNKLRDDGNEINPFYLPPVHILSDILFRYIISLQSIFQNNNCRYIMFQGHVARHNDGSNAIGEINFNSNLGKCIDKTNWITEYGLRDYCSLSDNLTECEHADVKGNKNWTDVLYSKYEELYL